MMDSSVGYASADVSRTWKTWALLSILIATVAVYATSFDGPFIFDDLSAIPDNPHIRKLWPLTEAMQSPERASVAGRPLVSYSFAINYAISGNDVWSYHVGNLLIHLVNALLVFALIRRTLSLPSVKPWLREHALLIAWSVSLIWAVHPINSETVIYVVQRTELMVSTFMLLGFLALQKAARMECGGLPPLSLTAEPHDQSGRSATNQSGGSPPHSKSGKIWQMWVVVCVIFGLLCKELAAVMPFLLLIYDRAFLSETWKQVFKRRWVMYLALVPTWALAAWLAIEGHRGGLAEGDSSMYWRYPLTQGGVILWYIRLVFFPHPLAITYHWPMVDGVLDSLPESAIVLVLLLGTFYAIWRHPKWGFLGACFFFILAPTSSFIPIMTEVAGERRMYLPSLSILIPTLLSALWLLRSANRPATASIALAVVVAALTVPVGLTTYARSSDFDDVVKIWSQTLRAQPNHPAGLNNLAVAYIRLERFEEATELLDELERVSPRHILLPMNRGLLAFHQGEYLKATEYFEEAARRDPGDNLADIYAYSALCYGMIGENGISEAMFAKAMEVEPANRLAGIFLGLLLVDREEYDAAVDVLTGILERYDDSVAGHSNLAIAFDKLNRPKEARKHFQRAYALEPDSVEMLRNYAAFEARRMNWEKSEHLYQEALTYNPEHKDIRISLAQLYRQTERYEKSEELFRLLLREYPKDPVIHNRYGVLLIATERYDQAVEHFSAAVQYDPDYEEAQRNLAMTRMGLQQMAEEKAAKDASAE